MTPGTWQPPATQSNPRPALEELLVSFDAQRPHRVLVVPALLDEANKLRRLTISMMRLLDEAGIDSALPDLPGCNESLAPLHEQTLAGWRSAMAAAAQQFRATHVLALRAGALLAPADLPGWRYSPVTGARLLAGLVRAELIAAREAGRNQSRERLMEHARREGIMLSGWHLGAEMVRELEHTEPEPAPHQSDIAQEQIGGAGLWLRAEPGESGEQAEALAALISAAIAPEPGTTA